jgi:hypothetical protein
LEVGPLGHIYIHWVIDEKRIYMRNETLSYVDIKEGTGKNKIKKAARAITRETIQIKE